MTMTDRRPAFEPGQRVRVTIRLPFGDADVRARIVAVDSVDHIGGVPLPYYEVEIAEHAPWADCAPGDRHIVAEYDVEPLGRKGGS